MSQQQIETFKELMQPILRAIADTGVTAGLEDKLNTAFPPGAEMFRTVEQACHEAIEAGWMCSQGGQGRRFGRVVEACSDTQNLSIDVVDLTDVVGPHHRHPTGEVCLVMPVTKHARFDGHGPGWCVNLPGTAHHPTVS